METAERNATTRLGTLLAAAALLLTSCSPDGGEEASSPEPDGQADRPSPEPAGIGGAGTLSQIGAVDLPHLAAGDQWVHLLRYFPGDVEVDEDNVEEADVSRSDYRILADALFGGTNSWESGQSAVAYLIYPDIGADELTLDSPAEHEGHSLLTVTAGVDPWRFEDVPVTGESFSESRGHADEE